MIDLSALTEQQITHRLSLVSADPADSNFPPDLLIEPLKPAAVLIPMLRVAYEWHLLYIRRTLNHHDPHSGQIAFPGGGADPGDLDAEETALREAHEEIGVLPADVRLLGRLNDFKTITSFCVTPVVGRIPWPYPISLETAEVSKAFTIPLAWLAAPENHHIERRSLPAPYEPVPIVYFEPYEGELLWGATAGFTIKLLNTLSAR